MLIKVNASEKEFLSRRFDIGKRRLIVRRVIKNDGKGYMKSLAIETHKDF